MTRIVCGMTGILLVGVWCWFSDTMTYLALDYPFRLAGRLAPYPPFGTLPFYGECMSALLRGMRVSCHVWGIPFLVSVLLLFKAFAVTSGWSRCLLFLTLLFLPSLACGTYLIFRTMH